jgi:hypothetical protein
MSGIYISVSLCKESYDFKKIRISFKTKKPLKEKYSSFENFIKSDIKGLLFSDIEVITYLRKSTETDSRKDKNLLFR